MVNVGYDIGIQAGSMGCVPGIAEFALRGCGRAGGAAAPVHRARTPGRGMGPGRTDPGARARRGPVLQRAEDDLSALERGVVWCRYTVLVASSAARADQWTQFAGLLAEHLGIDEGEPRLLWSHGIAALGDEAHGQGRG